MMKQFIQVFKNLVLTGVLLLFSQNMYAQRNGSVTISVDGIAKPYYFGDVPSGSTAFHSHDFGTVSSLFLTDLEFNILNAKGNEKEGELGTTGTLSYHIYDKNNHPVSADAISINWKIVGAGNDYHVSISGLTIDFTEIKDLHPWTIYKIHLNASVESPLGTYRLNENDSYVATFNIPFQFNVSLR
ncbi:MAG: hypothetical protein LBT29_00845 [Flavobacteriaceae bacterium]|jgi:hypothetical protein|nr:hypothetical protein [Flavobacteriaceae bacterium]